MADEKKPVPNIVFVMASIVAASLVKDFSDKEFRGMKSPRFEDAMWKAMAVAESLYKRGNS